MVHSHVEFNEILSVGYFEAQRMNFHTDDEPGLGPTVASISLGCPALMKFRKLKLPRLRNSTVYSQPMDTPNLGGPAIRLTLRLNHGDIMIMHGADIQAYWEHAAQPLGLFRIAATARLIGSENHVGKNIKKEMPAIAQPSLFGLPEGMEDDLFPTLQDNLPLTSDGRILPELADVLGFSDDEYVNQMAGVETGAGQQAGDRVGHEEP